MKNRLMMAPLTNLQSQADGVLSDEEQRWLVMRAQGGFGVVMTCAAHVQAIGQGFPGQLGVFSDAHMPRLAGLAEAIHAHDTLAVVQLHHAGLRSPAKLIGGQPLAPSDNAKAGARGMTAAEVQQLIADFVAAAKRAERCGFDGVELHGAHGYVLAQFISPRYNQRTDDYGGSLANRSRIVFEIIERIRADCRADFSVGLRLSPERFGQTLTEGVEVAQRALACGMLDYVDMSLWDYAKEPEEDEHKGRLLRDYYLELDRGNTRLGVAGKIYSAAAARECLDAGFDYVSLGRAAILHHDFPQRVQTQPDFEIHTLPVSVDYLHREGLSDKFVNYMRSWDGFVGD